MKLGSELYAARVRVGKRRNPEETDAEVGTQARSQVRGRDDNLGDCWQHGTTGAQAGVLIDSKLQNLDYRIGARWAVGGLLLLLHCNVGDIWLRRTQEGMAGGGTRHHRRNVCRAPAIRQQLLCVLGRDSWLVGQESGRQQMQSWLMAERPCWQRRSPRVPDGVLLAVFLAPCVTLIVSAK